jgi:hypothetical protein
LLDMAMEYDVPMAAIQLDNEMGDSTIVQVGQVLSIPPRAGWESASRFWVVHVVEAGETLASRLGECLALLGRTRRGSGRDAGRHRPNF